MTSENNKKLKKLIDEGYLVKENNLHNRGDVWENIHGEEYNHWISKSTLFLKNNFNDSFLTDKFIQASENAAGNGVQYFNEMIGVLKALMDDDNHKVLEVESVKTESIDKIFISHSSTDEEYVKLFVNLLNDIGIKKDKTNIFCSSIPGYDIPQGEKIYDYIKNQFNHNILVIFILSENYYDSIACLNEMGATWVTSKEYVSVLLPTFSFSKIQGAIDPTVISFKMDNKARLNSFREKIMKLFNIDDYDFNIWEQDRDDFLSRVEQLVRADQYKNKLQKVNVEKVIDNSNELQITLRFINKGKLPSQCIDLLIGLIDYDGNELEFNVDHNFLDEIVLYDNENRREIFKINKENIDLGNFNVRKWKSSKTNSFWSII